MPSNPPHSPFVRRRLDPDALAWVVAWYNIAFGIASILNPVLFIILDDYLNWDVYVTPLLWGALGIVLGLMLHSNYLLLPAHANPKEFWIVKLMRPVQAFCSKHLGSRRIHQARRLALFITMLYYTQIAASFIIITPWQPGAAVAFAVINVFLSQIAYLRSYVWLTR
jgi:hypothetical protein